MKKMKALAGGRGRAPSLAPGKAHSTGPSTQEKPSGIPDTCVFLSTFVTPSRTLLLEGPVELQRGLQRRGRYLFLFDDLLVVAKTTYSNRWKVKNEIKLSDMWIASCGKEVGGGNTDPSRSFVLGWPTVNFVATLSSPEEKDRWLFLLQRYISVEKEKRHPMTIPLKIFTKDIIGNGAYCKTITIRNSDTANDVINTSLPMLRVTGSERDYQLWVNSAKEKASRPLIGHECPYAIKMSHLRDTALLMHCSEDATNSFSLQELCLMEELPREMRCQFTLKPRCLAAAQKPRDSGQKSFQRRRSITKWLFGRGSSAHLGNLPTSPTSPVSGQLFGVSLPNLCRHDNLPKPVWDMLFCVHQKGPLTKGIFRQSASMKSCRELKEKLDSGVEVHLDHESIFVIASVFKDFLKHIPGSVLSSDLFDHWVSVMDEENDEQKINKIQRLLDQLPRANIVLLRYLFGVLHNIEQNSSFNQMTAFNLAVCIAPSMLWPPASFSLELENEFIKKSNLLIQFLVENCCRIFGEEITSLFGESSVRHDTTERASDTPGAEKTAIPDSGEMVLSEDFDASCSDLVENLDEESRSTGCVLNFQDNHLDQPEVEDLLSLSDIDLDFSKEEDIEKQWPLECTLVAMSVVSCSHMPAHDSSKNQPFDAETSGHPPPQTTVVLQSSSRHQCCTEPNTKDQPGHTELSQDDICKEPN
ncbi:LOW QUALITY PROTEIN: rho GTPase-activating protein 20-like [Sturnira hondurensis]|uniref:LOW QUALITY PROTEIN: rho GTPase-activating protein 20-like n=1 Tax=Sturnira hondurensis TaxID=192404 RepID=UPI00187A87EC|nr:LOW QUALITY PROTEIN: rho GTPase-activating protein 20-like [Sturnira hondurensis]